MFDSPEAKPISPVPWLFTAQGLGLLTLVTLIAATFSALEVALLAGTLLAVGLLARAWSALALKRVRYTRQSAPLRAFCGDTVPLETSLVNRKPLPLPWVEVWERLPRALGIDGPTERSIEEPDRFWFAQSAALLPYQRARFRHQVQCRHRGAFTLDDGWIRSGDPFSLVERLEPVDGRLEVIVYPRVVPLQRLGLRPRHASLDVVGPRSLVTDPTRTASLRGYLPGDSPRLIHWPTTARRGALQVRVLEPATSLYVSLVLDLRGFAFLGGAREALLEMAISAVASIAVYLHAKSSPTSLFANTEPPLQLPMGAGAAHLQAILEGLARVQPLPVRPLYPWLLEHLPRGSTVLLAASETSSDLGKDVQHLQAAGFDVVVLLAGFDATPMGPSAQNVIRLAPDRDLAATLEGRV